MTRRAAASAYLEALLRAAEQGLLDLAATGGSDVVFVREHRAPPSVFIEAVEARATALGFVVSVVAVGHEHGFESLDVIVRALATNVRAPGKDERGVLALLDAFARSSGKRALERFDEASLALGFDGDLATLSRAYLAAKNEDRQEVRNLKAFFAGTDTMRHDEYIASSTLQPRNAKRTLVELTRLARVLDHTGSVFIVRRAGLLTELSPARRESAYTVLRELVDNADGPRGGIHNRLYVCGADELFVGPRCINENAPLATRVLEDAIAAENASLLPHATLVHLEPISEGVVPATREPEEIGPRRARALRTIVRATHGLPPLEHIADITVGYERIDDALDRLFLHTSNEGSVFSLLSGDYGSGKTHLLMHVTARGLAEKRPVLRLSVERLDTDLGNPQRHMRRLIEATLLPGAGSPSPIDRLAAWCRNESGERRVARALEVVSEAESDASVAARKALRALETGGVPALEACLGAYDLESKSSNPPYRQDAYARLLLWLELLQRLDDCQGPIVLIDEAENLYRGGTSRPERRTALRSLAFYCGGTLPRACVIFAVTPETLSMLREEAEEMLEDITEQRTVLACEDVTMLRRRLLKARPIDVARLGRDDFAVLAKHLRELHASARGAVRDPEWDDFVTTVSTGKPTPRELVRSTVARLESRWWLRS